MVELESKFFDSVSTLTAAYPHSHVYVHEPKQKVDLSRHIDTHHFMFDNAFDEFATNEVLYCETTRPLVETFLKGGRATFFAYGGYSDGKLKPCTEMRKGKRVAARPTPFLANRGTRAFTFTPSRTSLMPFLPRRISKTYS
jgi:hypothetical protein